MINFAHGDIYMLGSFVALAAFTILAAAGITSLPLALLVVLLITVMFAAGYGLAVERVAYRPLRGSSKLAPLISAIGASVFLQNGVQLLQGARIKHLPPMMEGGFQFFGQGAQSVRISYVQLLIIAATVVLLLGFTWMITRT
jgi:branched-chain amino acid transport system permease protein